MIGRRNITPEQASFLRGKRYLAEKRPQGAPEGNKNSAKQSSQNGHFDLKTHEQLAAELGVSPKTIQNDAEFAEAIDTLEKHVDRSGGACDTGDVKALS